MKELFETIFALFAMYALCAIIVSLIMLPIGDWMFWARYGGASLVLVVVCRIVLIALKEMGK